MQKISQRKFLKIISHYFFTFKVSKRGSHIIMNPNQGYPPQQQGYPPQQGGYPPQQQQGYPPQQQGYPPQQQQGYPPQQQGYPPQHPQGVGGFAQHGALYPPPQYQISQQPITAMRKGQCFYLQGTRFMLGLGWEEKRGRGEIDLDAYIFMVTDTGDLYDELYYGDKSSKDSTVNPAVRLLQDNQGGKGRPGDDDEQILIDLSLIERRVMQLFLVVKIHSGATNFGEVQGEFVRIVDQTQNREISRYAMDYDQSVQGSKAVWFCSIYRDQPGSDRWIFRGVGEATTKETRFGHYYDRHINMIGGKSKYSKKKKKK